MNLKNQIHRDQKSLESFEKFQKIWHGNIQIHDRARRRLNAQENSKNHAANAKQQTAAPDITLLERIDLEVLPKKNTRDLFEASLPSANSTGFDWMSSLRNYEHDPEYDGAHLQLLPGSSKMRLAAGASTLRPG